MFLQIKYLIGVFLNAMGVPGFLQDGEYEAGICKAKITVKRGGLFTVVSVNGLDVYFWRYSGRIDGVGFSLVSDCKQADTPKLTHSAFERIMAPDKVQT